MRSARKIIATAFGALLSVCSSQIPADSLAPMRPLLVNAKSGDCEFAMLLRDRNNKPLPTPPHTQSGAYRAGSLEPEWTVDWYAKSIALLDCDKLMRQGPWASSERDLAIAFYDQGKELMSYLIEDLVTDTTALRHSTSHFVWRFASHLDVKKRTYQIDTVDGHRYVFSADTGLILKYEPLVYSDAKELSKLLRWSPEALDYATEELRNDRELLLPLISLKYRIICHAGDSIRSDTRLALDILSFRGRMLGCFDDSIRLNKKYVLHALNARSSINLKEIPTSFHDDREIVQIAIKKRALNYKSIKSDLIRDPDIINLAIRNGFWVPFYSPDQEIINNPSFVISTLQQISSDLKTEYENLDFCADLAPQSHKEHLCERFGSRSLLDLRYVSAALLTNQSVTQQLDETIRTAVLGDESRFESEKESLLQHILKSAEK